MESVIFNLQDVEIKVIVRGIVQDADNRILYSKRSSTNLYPNFWEYPGGKPDPGESLKKTVYREIYEETNVKTSRIKFHGLQYDFHSAEERALNGEQKSDCLYITYFFKAHALNPQSYKIPDSEKTKISALKWMPQGAFPGEMISLPDHTFKDFSR